MEDHEIIDTLNMLIETSRDGETSFSTCAADADDPALKAYFTICATRCRESVHLLNEMVLNYGGTPEDSGTVMGSFRRAWLNLRAALTSNSDLAVLEECADAEDIAMQTYRDALAKNLPMDVYSLAQLQLNGLVEHRNRVHMLLEERRRLAA